MYNTPRRLLLAASLSFDRMRNQRARNKNNFLPYREVTPDRRQLQIETVSIRNSLLLVNYFYF
jgi:hypothetical protein